MDKKIELTNILRAELTLLTKDILQNIHQKDVNDLYKASRKLYEKMAAIQLLSGQLEEAELLAIINEIPSQEKVEEAPVTPEKSKQAVEKESDEIIKKETNPYKDLQHLSFSPKGQKDVQENRGVSHETKESSFKKPEKISGKKMNIGLNDRIAFINNLFNGDQQAYADTIEKLNNFDSYEAALSYIYKEVKPRYNQWEAKDEYEFRLIQLLELKFA